MKSRLAVAVLIAGAAVSRAAAQTREATPLDSISPQASLAGSVTVHLIDQPLRVVIAEVARQSGVSVVFDPSLASLDRKSTVHADRASAAKVLLRALDGSGLHAVVTSGGSVVITNGPRRDDSGSYLGGVVTQPDGPLEAVRLSLAGTRFEAISDQAGRFSFGAVPRGDYTLRAMRMGFAPLVSPLHVDIGNPAPLRLAMQPAAVPVDAVIVTPGYVGVMQPGLATSQSLSRQQIETVPQLGEDVYRTVGRLPGVATDDMSANFTLRGEPTQSLYVTLDGMPLIEPFHLRDLGSGLSIVDLSALGRAELIAGGPSAEYGDQIGGVFNLHSVEPRRDRARTSAGFSITNVRGMSQGGFAGGNGAWLVSARQGFLDYAFKLAKIEDSISPRYNDLFAKVLYDLPGGGQISAHALRAGDRLKYLADDEPSIVSRYVSEYYWLTLSGRVGDKLRQQTTAWTNDLDWTRRGFESGGPFQQTVEIHDARRLRTFGARSEWSLDLGARALLKAGGDVRRDAAHYDYSKVFARHVVSSGLEVQTIDTGSARLDPSGDVLGVYLSQRIRPLDALTLEVGARYDRATHTRDAYASRRVNAAWQPTPSTTVRAAWGEHSQSEAVFDLQVQHGVVNFQPAEHSRQASIGIEQSAWKGTLVRAEAYDRWIRDVRSRYASAAARIYPLSEIDYDLVLFAPTRARSRGLELTVERESGRSVDWSMSYVRSSTREELDGTWIPRRTDQPNAVRADWSYHPPSNHWRIALSGVRHSGWPYTPELVRLDTVISGSRTSIYVTRTPGELYSRRATPYHRLDARWTRFVDTRSGRFSLFVDVYNVLNNTNERERLTTVSFSATRASFGEESRVSLPRIPSFGINWEF